MPDSWLRKHDNGLFGRVEKTSDIGDRYVASVGRSGEPTHGSHHATLELAKAKADADVRATGHHCSDACEPWHVMKRRKLGWGMGVYTRPDSKHYWLLLQQPSGTRLRESAKMRSPTSTEARRS